MRERICKNCGQMKLIDAFAKNGKNGNHPRCKICMAESERDRRLKIGDAIRTADRARYNADKTGKVLSYKKYYEANRAAILARNAKRYDSQSEKIKKDCKDYREANKHKVREWNGTRRARLRNACPPWADREAIAAIYAEAARLEAETGIPYHVDHIIPLAGRNICGLHIASNLQAIPATENLRKGRKL
jgi:hypothetical protein